MIVDVSGGMTLAQVIMRFRESQGGPVTVRILPDSSLLLTANEFRALSLAAEREQVAIAVETDDALRRQLASLFGVPLSIPIEPEELEPIDPAGSESGTDAPESFPIVYLNGGQGAALAGEPGDAAAGAADSSDMAIDNSQSEQASRTVHPRKRRTGARWILGIAGLAVLAVLAAGGYWWFFGTATAQVMLETQPVTTNVSFTVVSPGGEPPENGGITVPGQPVSFNLSVTLDAPATGTVTMGDLTASGSIVLRNPGEEAVTITAGSEITTFEGEVFVFEEDVAVPAATPEGTAGEVTAVVSAAAPGAAGNRDIGMLSGQLENGVYFSNRTTPVAGGTDQTMTVVTDEDLASLQAGAEQALRSLASTSSLAGNLRVVPSSLTPSNLQTDFSHQSGDEADSVSVDATVTFDAVAFPAAALDSAAQELLPSSAPAGHEILQDQMVYEAPIETRQQNGSWAMIVPVTGQAAVSLSDEQLEQITRDLTGMSESEAEDYLGTREHVVSYALHFEPGWMPHRMPVDAGRITVEVE
ncbi:hypothetical protein BH24CHL4_BH24CHL4_12360 [soil metagenome]